jgi:RNA recognition motif-containing protein
VTKRLYVGNLSYTVTEDQLRSLFEQVGEIEKVTVITDRETGRSKGFGFVQMADPDLAQEAIRRFNGFSFVNRNLTVNEAKPREERGGGRDGGGDGGGYRRDSYGDGGGGGGYRRDSYGEGGGNGGGYNRRDRGDRY